jgi:hypothetical protein
MTSGNHSPLAVTEFAAEPLFMIVRSEPGLARSGSRKVPFTPHQPHLPQALRLYELAEEAFLPGGLHLMIVGSFGR